MKVTLKDLNKVASEIKEFLALNLDKEDYLELKGMIGEFGIGQYNKGFRDAKSNKGEKDGS